MWFRLRPDIGYGDLAYGLLKCLAPGGRERTLRELERLWAGPARTFACLSVRTGFDLMWEALALPAGSEVVVTALTIPDMWRILERHQLVPVPLDISPDSLAPDADSLRRCLGPRTKAVVLTHLFGARIPVEPLLPVLADRRILLIEDCAQAFAGRDGYTGHARADVAMFSFGPIKTATALGGALFRVEDAELLRRMARIHAGLPAQRLRPFFGRLWKYLLLKLATGPRVWGVIARVCAARGVSYDTAIRRLSRGFGGKNDFFAQIRRQPCTPLLALLRRRLEHFDAGALQRRRENGERLARLLSGRVPLAGTAAGPSSFWLFPVLSERKPLVISRLRSSGFDASEHHSLDLVPVRRGVPRGGHDGAHRLLDALMFVPAGAALPAREIARLAACLSAVVAEAGDSPGGETGRVTAGESPRAPGRA